MPLPQSLAVTWCVGSIAETAVAGLLVGWIVKEPKVENAPVEAETP